ncbi:MAG TPA: hypothetical protein VK204_19185 [Nocardioidaceae bacterium]|nr:hypothetical protein [Nocardioidaceae bacterium]
MIVFGMLLVGVVVLSVALMLALRRWTLDEARTETRLHQPGAHTVVYAVPNGQDPAILMAALSREGFTAVSDTEGGQERLLVECPDEHDRAQVRSIIEHVDRAGFDGPEMHVSHVSFEDER